MLKIKFNVTELLKKLNKKNLKNCLKIKNKFIIRVLTKN